jgi:hypothetical protein
LVLQIASPKTRRPAGNRRTPLVTAAKVGREPVGDDIVERLSVADRGEDVGWGDGLDKGEERVRVGRRVVSVVPDHRQDPPVLLREEYQAAGPARLGADGDELLAGQGVGAQAQVSGGVLQVDRELLLRRLVTRSRALVAASPTTSHRSMISTPGSARTRART